MTRSEVDKQSREEKEAFDLVHTSVEDIKSTIDCARANGKPISPAVLKRALNVETDRMGARVTVLRIIDRELRRQEEE